MYTMKYIQAKELPEEDLDEPIDTEEDEQKDSANFDDWGSAGKKNLLVKDPVKNALISRFVDEYMNMVSNKPEESPASAGLQEVKELPEEEEGDNTSLRFSVGSKSRNYFRAKAFCNSCQSQILPCVRSPHTKCLSSKLPAKLLDENDEVREDHKETQPSLLKTPQTRSSEDTCAVLNFIHSTAAKEQTDVSVHYIIDSSDDFASWDGAKSQSKHSLVSRNCAMFPSKSKYSQSLVVPHMSDDPAIDSEEQNEFEEKRRKYCTTTARKSCSHRRNVSITFDQETLRKIKTASIADIEKQEI